MMDRSSNEEKHESANPAVRFVMSRFHRSVTTLIGEVGPRRLLEVGCGEGYVLDEISRAHPDIDLVGIDLSERAVVKASRRLADRARVEVMDAFALGPDGYDVVLMLEVLEHLEDPQKMLEVLSDVTDHRVLLSVPWEPWFRILNVARFKHLTRLGNHPEHVQHWTRAGFISLVETMFEIEQTPMVFPWTMVLARPK